jgi:Family of unknown function (DUF5677)
VFAIELRRRGRATEAFVALADRLNDTRFEVGTATPQVAVTEFARATKTLRAVCLLVRDGYGPQALVLARTIFESTLAVRWALEHPAVADEQMDLHGRLELTVEDEAWQRSGISRGSSAPARPLTTDERAKAEALFGRRATAGWTGHKNIKELVNELADLEQAAGSTAGVFLRDAFTLMLGWADRMTHTTFISTRSSGFAAESRTGEYSAGPSSNELFHALQLGGSSYAVLLSFFLPTFAPQLTDDLQAVDARYWRAWKDITLLAAVRGDDKCLCDRPSGTWKECHGSTDPYSDRTIERLALSAVSNTAQ